jgi:hypothetical protein
MVGKLAQAGFGDNFCKQLERRDWDDNREVFDKICLSAEHNWFSFDSWNSRELNKCDNKLWKA